MVNEKEIFLDNRYIIPYNLIMTLKYMVYINIEIYITIKVIKYIIKYVNKGLDLISIQLSGSNINKV